MKLYSIFTRQTEPIDNQYFSVYHVWAGDEQQAKEVLQGRLQYVVIRNAEEVCENTPMILLQTS